MLIDLLIIILLISAAVRGHEIGLVRQLFSAGGFIGGLFLAAWLVPRLFEADAGATDVITQALVALSMTLLVAMASLSLGEYVGVKLKRRLMAIFHLNRVDALAGSLAGGAVLLLAVWLLTPSLANLPSAELKKSLQESRIAGLVSHTLPSAPDFITSLDKIINPNGFPDVFAGLDRRPLDDGTPLPDLGALRAAVEAARPSVVKMEGRGCGGIVEGSGYVARDGIIVTNAHVIAGVQRPTVLDTNGRHTATPIWFDPDLDMAVLRADNLAGKPLASGPVQVPASTAGAVLGYPGGGSFRAGSATILDQFTAIGRDIYDSGRTRRNIYELKADIIPGNSGGPLINAEGQVIGLIFAESTTYEQIGYALSMAQVNAGLAQAMQRNQPVSSGACAE